MKALQVSVLAASLPAVFLLNLYYSNPLYQLGVDLILWMQQFSSPPLDLFFIFFTAIIDPVFIATSVVLLLVLMKRRLTAYSTGLFIILNTYLLTILKCFDAEPRPYWTHAKVRTIGYYCPRDYGSPSGHAQFTAVVACCLIFEFLDTKRQKGYLCLSILLMVCVSISRMYLGHHSLDQVAYGLYFGIAISVLYMYGGLRETIKKLLVVDSPLVRNTLWLLILGGYLLSLLGYYGRLQQIDSHSKEAKLWIKNLNHKCNSSINEHHLNQMMLMLNCLNVSNFAGCSFGFRSLTKREGAPAYMLGEWQVNSKRFANKWISYIAFYLSGIVIPVLAYLLTLLIPLLWGRNQTTKLIQTNLAVLLGSYFFTAYAYPIQRHFNLIDLTPTLKQD